MFEINDIKRISFRKDVNGLRAVAVLGVVLYHSGFSFSKGGWLGVDVFFVISGFLISNIIISELNEGNFKLKVFYKKKIIKILIALYSSLIFSSILAYFLLSPTAMIEYSKSLNSSIFFYANYYLQNLDFYNSAPAKFMPLIHTWSLAIEEQFYIFYPVLLIFIYKFLKKYFLIIFLSTSLLSIYINTETLEIIKFYQIQFRAWELLLGAILMILQTKFCLKYIHNFGIFMIIFSFWYFDDSFILDIEPKLICLFGVSLILLFNNEYSLLTKVLSLKMITVIGISSFSLYLLHQPIFAYYRIYISGRFIQESTFIIISLITGMIVIGYFSYLVIEVKLANSKYLFHILFALTFFLLAFSAISLRTEGMNYRFSDNYKKVEKYYSEEQREGIPESRCGSDKDFEYVFFCDSSYSPKNNNIIIIGDSHLITISKFLYDELSNKYNIYTLLQEGCSFLIPLENNTRAGCGSLEKQREFERINSKAKTITIYGGRFPWYVNGTSFTSSLGSVIDNTPSGGLETLNGLKSNIEYLNLNSDKSIIISPIPELGIYPLEAFLYDYYEIFEIIQFDFDDWQEYSKETNLIINNYSNNVVSVSDIFCNSYVINKCVASFGGKVFYYDDDHLSYDGAELLGKEIIKKISKLD